MVKKKIFIAIILFIISSGCWSQQVRFDGYYHTLSDSLNPFRYYLRFYEDGTVINYCTAGSPDKLLKWFSKNDNASLKGKYAQKDSTLSFSVKNQDGEVAYEGVLLSGERLWMKVKSLINKYEGKEEYFFQPATGLK